MGGGRIRRWRITTAYHTTRTYLVGRHFDSPNYTFLFWQLRGCQLLMKFKVFQQNRSHEIGLLG